MTPSSGRRTRQEPVTNTYNLRQAATALTRTDTAPGRTPAADLASAPLFRTGNAVAEVFHLVSGQGVPRHRHYRGDDVFIGITGHVVVKVWDGEALPAEYPLTRDQLVVVPAGHAHAVVCDSPSASYVLLQAPADETDITFEPDPAQAGGTQPQGGQA